MLTVFPLLIRLDRVCHCHPDHFKCFVFYLDDINKIIVYLRKFVGVIELIGYHSFRRQIFINFAKLIN